MTSLSSTSFFSLLFSFFFFNDTATTEIYTLSLHDALPILTLDGHFSQTYSQSPFGYVVSGFDHSAFDNLRNGSKKLSLCFQIDPRYPSTYEALNALIVLASAEVWERCSNDQ